MNGPIIEFKDKWLRDWLDALAFSRTNKTEERISDGLMSEGVNGDAMLR